MSFKPNRKTKLIMKKLSEFVEAVDNDFFYVVMGGISVDGFVGRLTRNHPDVDFSIFRKDLDKAEKVLGKLGYKNKRFFHPDDPTLEYKMQTGDEEHDFSFQVLDPKGDNFEISFYNFPRMRFPISLVKPVTLLTLEGVKYPSVTKDLLIKLKENQISHFNKLKTKDPKKYKLKRKDDHLKSLHDLKLLKSI
ncbi:hypothetical protein A2955_01215 [Candidatus Woesebacteria bacterium RIFCSPLOWO2_01_FULL_37_19]|uniref:Uncharacterized protein n=1 Tax=Candidatus Woesebacteria bacterium RIFCSPLOWO2_01_FULL_37_19 TaxID=1802514 RepID=A0A1F8B685_9BACT|nr:MAG: hypothetical protein A2955_01215 [Candidatus Woesebacteria bacterium RIFCSPLOWO2_01_FULL_37_19]